MRALILVGGFGTRLRPLTNDTPKQMLPVVDRPMIEHVVAHLARHGVEQVVLSLGFKPDAFLAGYPDGTCAGIPLHYAVEPEPLDTAGAVRFAASDAGIDDTFLVMNGDVLTDLDIGALVARHRETGAEGTIHLTPVDDPSRYGVVPIDADGRVEAFIEKPARDEAPSNWINAGTYVLEPSVLGRIPEGRKVSIERETFPAIVADRGLYGFQAAGYWVDAGTPQTYAQVQFDLIDGVRGDPWPAVAADATIADDARVEHSIVMAGARVGAGAELKDAIVFPRATIGDGATVVGSIIGADAVIDSGAVIEPVSIIGQGTTIASGARLADARVPQPD
jgi:mannose-1-phosphate guanylyltransferase